MIYLSVLGAAAERQSIGPSPARLANPTSPLVRLRLLLLALLCALIPTARAHDPFEAFHSATLYPDRLELVVTMAQSTVLKLIDSTANIPALTPENLSTHHPRLVRAAVLLFILTSAKKQLSAHAANVELTEENDLIFRVTYPRPAPGKLYFSAAYLRNLGDGYGGIIEIDDDTSKNLGWEHLLWAHPNFEVTVPSNPFPRKT